MRIYGYYDVVVVGGGASGSCAAIAAAREGAKVCLIETLGSVGGMLNIVGPQAGRSTTSTMTGAKESWPVSLTNSIRSSMVWVWRCHFEAGKPVPVGPGVCRYRLGGSARV